MTVLELQKKYLPLVAPEDFFVLLAHATHKEKVFLLAHPEYTLSATATAVAVGYLARRQKHEPVAYITGEKEFYGLSFKVTRDTLIPRPETELLVERAIDRVRNQESGIKNQGKAILVDVGTGSGNIIISIATELMKFNSQFSLHATDISSEALTIARINAKHHRVTDIISFHEGTLLEPLVSEQSTANQIIIVANLPYLSTKIYRESIPDVQYFEPRNALESGIDGLDHYRQLLQTLPLYSKSFLSSTLLFEISPEQSAVLTALIRQHLPLATISLSQDLSGKNRLIQATL